MLSEMWEVQLLSFMLSDYLKRRPSKIFSNVFSNMIAKWVQEVLERSDSKKLWPVDFAIIQKKNIWEHLEWASCKVVALHIW